MSRGRMPCFVSTIRLTAFSASPPPSTTSLYSCSLRPVNASSTSSSARGSRQSVTLASYPHAFASSRIGSRSGDVRYDEFPGSSPAAFHRMKIEECKRRQLFKFGFIDPDKVHEETLKHFPKDTEKNLLSYHWILLDIQLDKGRVEVMDPLKRDPEGFRSMHDMLQRVWNWFKRKVDGAFTENLTFTPVPCATHPQGTNLCGYYVCEFIRKLTTEHNNDRFNVNSLRGKLLPEDRLLGVTDELAGFLMKEIIDDAGLFSVNRRF